MIRWTILLFLASFSFGQEANFQIAPLKVKSTIIVNTEIITENVEKLAEYKVPITVERLTIMGPVDKYLIESNFLQSGLAYDFNHDGDTNDKIEISETLPDGTKIQPFIDPVTNKMHYYDQKGKARIYKYGDKGLPFCVYHVIKQNPPMVSIGLTHQGETVKVEHFPSPCIQVNVIKKHQLPLTKIRHDIISAKLNDKEVKQFKKFQTFAYEPYVFSPNPEWIAVSWAIIPLPKQKRNKIALEIFDPVPGEMMVVIMVNHSPEKGTRVRCLPGFKIIK